MSEQTNLHGEKGWPEGEIPKEIEDKPELHLAWRGLVISITSDQISKEAAFKMLRAWEEQERSEGAEPSDVVDLDP